MKAEKWAALSPEEKQEIRARNQRRKHERTRREKQKEERLKQRYEDDDIGATLSPGDWMVMRKGWGLTCLQDKLVRFVDWDDDGHNKTRASRNKKIIVEVEPHLNEDPERVRTKLGGFRPVNAMQVIAKAAQ